MSRRDKIVVGLFTAGYLLIFLGGFFALLKVTDDRSDGRVRDAIATSCLDQRTVDEAQWREHRFTLRRIIDRDEAVLARDDISAARRAEVRAGLVAARARLQAIDDLPSVNCTPLVNRALGR